MRSLRLRFFLITWPLVMLATAGVALTFDRWTRTELRVLDERMEDGAPDAPGAVRALVAAWADGNLTDADMADRLPGAVDAAGGATAVDVLLMEGSGRVVATTTSTLRPDGPPDGLAEGQPVRFRDSRTVDGRSEELRLQLSGLPVTDSDGTPRGYLFVLPSDRGPEPEELGAVLRRDARRTLIISVGLAGVVSAVLALLLAGPLIRQVGRLDAAARRLRSGELGARVEPGTDDEVGRLERAFNAMADALERAEAHKRTLVSDVAHELRTPLTNVVGTLEAIQDGLRPADPETVAVLRREAGLLATLVDDLQELSLAESGQLRFDVARVDAAAVARDVVAAARPGAAGVVLEGPPADAPAVPLSADPRRLEQALGNLVRNALTHTPEGGRVTVEAVREGADSVLRVTDTGRGIPAEELPHVWERFRRVEPSRERTRGGAGLGLAIVRQFVETMGGRVGARSRPGHGSAFELRFPTPEDDATGA